MVDKIEAVINGERVVAIKLKEDKEELKHQIKLLVRLFEDEVRKLAGLPTIFEEERAMFMEKLNTRKESVEDGRI